jgi:DNA-binding NarL/FixJ family response regulator
VRFKVCVSPEVRLKDQNYNSSRVVKRHDCETGSKFPGRLHSQIPPAQTGSSTLATFESPENLNFSAEERRLIELILGGYSNRNMALDLSLSESCIYRRMVRLFAKLRVANKIELALFALYHGIPDKIPARAD